MTTTHTLIAQTARDLAGAYYETAAGRSNAFYREFPVQAVFIAKEWPRFLPTAREILVDMLTMKETTEHVKMQIYHALQHERGIENGLLIRPEALH